MQNKVVNISKVKPNPNNPRVIKDYKFNKLVASIQSFPEMLKIRPIVVNNDMVVLGGNMRLKACQAAGLKEVPVLITELNEEQQQEFIIKDNLSFGEWDWDMLANQWEHQSLVNWCMDLPAPQTYFETIAQDTKDDNVNVETKTPAASDDEYSKFELIMLYENKLTLIDALNAVKNAHGFNKQEDALMEIITFYNKHTK